MDAYTTALTLLARRELSTRQLRERLARRQFAPSDIEAAITRLTADRTLDDHRVATACARLHASVRGKGRRRVLQHVQRLGVNADTARSAVDEVFGDVDEAALLDRAIERRLRGAALSTLDHKARARLVRQVVAQGFDPSHVLTRLRRKGADVDE